MSPVPIETLETPWLQPGCPLSSFPLQAPGWHLQLLSVRYFSQCHKIPPTKDEALWEGIFRNPEQLGQWPYTPKN
jgi:hypothetical protein